MSGKLRVTGGTLLRRTFAVPKEADKGLVRPTSDRVREALFSALGPLEKQVVLDVFAGSGALGIEALSRGAARVTFVEKNPSIAKHLKQILRALKLDAQVHTASAVRGLQKISEESVDLLLADPPYALPIDDALLDAMSRVLREDGQLLLERDQRSDIPEPKSLSLVWDRKFGNTRVLLWEKSCVKA
ncbi:MAG: 16S rRNA (guanine(966)-N(2))-methyltransferase RsmD [Deltaproteobacteria bacterium]|nr:16S rRNA (guanine(966)-N(2))-methyltransferase RsmD [Deltaproteobacteria bacterium]